MTPIVQAIAIAAVAVGTGTATLTVMKDDPEFFAVPEAPWEAGSALDGQTFHLSAVIAENGEELTDEIIFRDGGFLSVNCQEYCDFGFSDYRTWTDGKTVHFKTTAKCPTAPHTVIWHGQVTDGNLTVTAQWTTDRWYWTRQINAVGTGVLNPVDDTGMSG